MIAFFIVLSMLLPTLVVAARQVNRTRRAGTVAHPTTAPALRRRPEPFGPVQCARAARNPAATDPVAPDSAPDAALSAAAATESAALRLLLRGAISKEEYRSSVETLAAHDALTRPVRVPLR